MSGGRQGSRELSRREGVGGRSPRHREQGKARTARRSPPRRTIAKWLVGAAAVGAAPGTFVFVYLGSASLGPGVYAALGGLAVLAVAAYAYLRRLRGERGWK